ncbi:MAG: hypothetical protein QW503_04660 [Sulfolobales archaeon]
MSGSREYRVTPVREGDNVQLRMPKRRIPWDRIISLLLEGHEVFIECDRRAAHYIRRRIEARVGELVEAYPAIYDGAEGYVFKLTILGKFG